MTVAVLVPYSSQGCEWRDRAWAHIRGHYATHHPDWPVIVGTCTGEWSKGAAIADALTRTSADTLVIADADSWVDPGGLREAVAADVPWAMPHTEVRRLSENATTRTYRGQRNTELARRAYRGVVGGGITVVRRDVYEQVPIDPRFYGWGGEDISWGWALRGLHGQPWRGVAVLWHLWHPPANIGLNGSPASSALAGRWRQAARHPDKLAAMIEEAKCSPNTSSLTS